MIDNIIELVVGDPDKDGHNISEVTCIKSNLSKLDVINAYESGSELLGFNFTQKYCIDYDDRSVPTEILDKLISKGFDIDSIDGPYDDVYHVYGEDFTKIYLFICQIGNPDFRYEIVQGQKIDIGGYGCPYA